MFRMRHVFCSLAVATLSLSSLSIAEDWPQWQGPNRDAISKETGLLKAWPEKGPPLLWQKEKLGEGYSTPSISKGKIYGMSYRQKDGGKVDGIWALDVNTGKELWYSAIGKSAEKVSYNDGTRSSPTIDGDRVYGLTTDGTLACMDVKDGKVVWKSNLVSVFGGRMMSGWGYSESPLVDGNKVIVTPGGNQATLVALDKSTGSVLWKSSIAESGGAGYASPVVCTAGGTKMYVTWLGTCIVGVDSESGKELWRYKRVAGRTANIPTPIVKDNFVFCSQGYRDGGAALVEIVKNGNKFEAKEVWYKGAEEFRNHHGGMVLLGEYLYGGHGQNDGQPACLEWKTGKVMYRERGPGKGSAAVASAEGLLYYRYQDGVVALLDANPNSAKVVSKFKLPYESGKASWPHPVISDGKLYIRDQDALLCFDIKAK